MIRTTYPLARTPVTWRRQATWLLAAAIVTTACSGQTATPGQASTATSRPAASPTTSAQPSPTKTAPALPGGRLVFERAVGEVESLFTIGPDGTDIKPLVVFGQGPRWSPDGGRISIVATSPQGLAFVGLVDPDGTHYNQFASPDPTLELGCFAWSPDGLRLACEGFDGSDVTRNGIYTVRAADGGGLVRLTSCPNGCHDIPTDYSPDGHQIVFTRQKLPDEADVTLMIVNVDGSDAQAITDKKLGGGRWSPDGEAILTDANGSLLLVPIDGAEIRTIRIESGATLNPTGAAWSPDGEWIVFSGHTDTGFDLYIMQTDGTSLHRVADTPNIWEGNADWR